MKRPVVAFALPVLRSVMICRHSVSRPYIEKQDKI